MRIAIFSELYVPSVGGQEVFFKGLSHALAARGHTIDVYCISHEQGLSSDEMVGDVRVHRFPEVPKYKRPHLKTAKRNWWAIVRFALHVRSVAKSGGHDFIILNQWPLLHAATLPKRVRHIALLHWCEVRHSLFFRLIQRTLPKTARYNAAISDAVAQEIGAASGRSVITLPSGLDLAQSRYLPRRDRGGIVVLGRVAEHKNLPLAIKAFELLKSEGYPGTLRIAGDGPALADVKTLASNSPFAADIEVLGSISDAEKFLLLAQAEIFAMSSTREGFPHVVAESMSSGLPVVTADFPENGTVAIVKAYGCGVVTDKSPAAFAAGLRQALDNWDQYSSSGLTAAATLDWKLIAERVERTMIDATSSEVSPPQ